MAGIGREWPNLFRFFLKSATQAVQPSDVSDTVTPTYDLGVARFAGQRMRMLCTTHNLTPTVPGDNFVNSPEPPIGFAWIPLHVSILHTDGANHRPIIGELRATTSPQDWTGSWNLPATNFDIWSDVSPGSTVGLVQQTRAPWWPILVPGHVVRVTWRNMAAGALIFFTYYRLEIPIETLSAEHFQIYAPHQMRFVGQSTL